MRRLTSRYSGESDPLLDFHQGCLVHQLCQVGCVDLIKDVGEDSGESKVNEIIATRGSLSPALHPGNINGYELDIFCESATQIIDI